MQKLTRAQFLPISLDQAWDFFATPANLNIVTPPDFYFKIRSELPQKMYEGMLITYTIEPFLRLPMTWVTEITHLQAPSFFVDEQRVGPFKIWHHEHHFKSVDGGILMTDILHYEIGLSFLGWLAGKLYVHKRVQYIFDYRFGALAKYFSK